MIEFDASELDRLVGVIGKQEARAAAGLYAIGTKAAVNVRDGMREQVAPHPHFAAMAGSITYEVVPAGLRTVAWRIGPDKDRRGGALGNIFYFGTSNNAPVDSIDRPLREERPRLERALLELGDF